MALRYEAASARPGCRSGETLKHMLQTFIQTCLKLSSSRQTQGVVGMAFYRRHELRVRCAASALRSSAEAASSVLSISPESWIVRVGRANSSTRQYQYENPSLDKQEILGEGVRSTYFIGQFPVLGPEKLQLEAHRGCYGYTIAEVLKENTPLEKRGSNSRTNIVCDVHGRIHPARCLQATCFPKEKDHVESGLKIMMLKTDEFGKFMLTLQGGQTL